jgi:hypothetical protein
MTDIVKPPFHKIMSKGSQSFLEETMNAALNQQDETFNSKGSNLIASGQLEIHNTS